MNPIVSRASTAVVQPGEYSQRSSEGPKTTTSNCRRRLLVKQHQQQQSSSRRVLQEERLIKNRKLVDSYLKRMGNHFGKRKELSLNDNGIACLTFQKFIIVIEVPLDTPHMIFLYSMVCRVQPQMDNLPAVLSKAMQLNYMQYGTRGATLGLDGEEVNLCVSMPISSIPNMNELRTILEGFMRTTADMHQQLEAAKRQKPTSTRMK